MANYTSIQMKVLMWNRSRMVILYRFSLKITANLMKLNQPFVLFLIHVVLTLYVTCVYCSKQTLFLKQALPSVNKIVCSRHVIGIQPIVLLPSQFSEKTLEYTFYFH